MNKNVNYAQALFDLVMERDCLDEVFHDFETFVAAVEQQPNWLFLMQSPFIDLNKKYELLEELSTFHPVFLNFLKTLVYNQVIHDYEVIYEKWRQLALEQQQIAHVRVVSAKPLTKEQIQIIREELWGWIEGKEIEMEVIIDKRLIGGIKIFYQGQTIDRSLYAQLEELSAFI